MTTHTMGLTETMVLMESNKVILRIAETRTRGVRNKRPSPLTSVSYLMHRCVVENNLEASSIATRSKALNSSSCYVRMSTMDDLIPLC
jgi:hypothetical protein